MLLSVDERYKAFRMRESHGLFTSSRRPIVYNEPQVTHIVAFVSQEPRREPQNVFRSKYPVDDGRSIDIYAGKPLSPRVGPIY